MKKRRCTTWPPKSIKQKPYWRHSKVALRKYVCYLTLSVMFGLWTYYIQERRDNSLFIFLSFQVHVFGHCFIYFKINFISWEKKILHLVYALFRKLFPVKLLLLMFIAKTCALVIMYILYNYGMKADNSEIMVILVKFSYVVVFYPRLNVLFRDRFYF